MTAYRTMSRELDADATDNLRRWQQSGQPQAWVDAHGGHWGHRDWLTLLANLRHCEFWPLEPPEAATLLERLNRERSNLHRLVGSGLARRWVEAHGGQWGHADWLGLLENLRERGFAPIQPDAVQRLLERLKQEWHNLRRWQQSGEPRRWVEAHGGAWGDHDWHALVRSLHQSEFWPLDLAAAGRALDGLKEQYRNLRRWVESSWPRRWVEAQGGRWDPAEWLALLERLRQSAYWPLDPDAVGSALEEARRRRQNLHRWERSGQPRRWVAARAGRWGHDDWLALLEGLRRSEFWPLDADAVGAVLAEIQAEWRNLFRWEQSAEVRQWIEARAGRWDRADWLALLEGLRRSEFWPLDAEAAEAVLERLTAEWWNLRSWRESGQPWLWVEARRGEWGHGDWLALLDSLRPSQFWPLDPEAVGVVLEQVKRQYGNLRRWRESGQPRRWVEARAGRWGRADWQALLDALHPSEFWPLDPAAVMGELDEIQAEHRNLARWRESGTARDWVAARAGRWGHDDWLALRDCLQRSEFWPVDPASVGRVLEEVRAAWPACRTPVTSAGEGPPAPRRQAA